ncbi:MAG TPA: hypothetical protein VMB79_08120 [Jatrophihabitans sp.]|nr:hypothetical protein [Jatrophihabitans sp.]
MAATTAGLLAAGTSPASAEHSGRNPRPTSSDCRLANGISHVVQIQFDNVHLTRDNPNIPSDLEQMPNLLNFMKNNGVVMANTHDVLVHTATNFISNQTGLYPDRTGITQSNSYSYYDGAGATHPGVSFAYWTDPVYDPTGASIDTRYNTEYVADRNKVPNAADVNTPAPWVPFTKAGCNVGEVGMSNTVLENIATDIPTVFGANSPQAAEAKADPAKATADVVGYAVHCAKTSTTCASGQTDALPDEPGGYAGYKALFGNAEIQPAVHPSGPITTLSGAPIADPKGNVGFPGFDAQTPDVSLGYAASLLEHNVPITNVYVSDVHTDHTAAHTGDLGPGEQTYEQQLHDYDQAFGAFFQRLAADGITPANTLFSVTTDEGDHFSGSQPTPANCTGAPGNYCSYTTRSEVNVNLPGLLATQANDTTPFAIHSDPAPALWVTGNPDRTDPAVRQLGRDLSGLTFTNPLTGANEKVAYQLADPVEEKILHFVSADAARTPTMTAFSGEDSYITGGAANCSKACVYTSSGYAWNHGGFQPDMQTIFASYAGPGVSARGVDSRTWTDQVDNRPTLLALAGLHDDYSSDGRVVTEILDPKALPAALSRNPQLSRLGALYKQLTAASGQFAADTLAISTKAVASGTASNDTTYQRLEAALTRLDDARDRLTGQIADALLGASFQNRPVSRGTATSLIVRSELLLAGTHALSKA